MKRFSLLYSLFLCALLGRAQDTVKQRNRLTQTVIENYFVLKTDKHIREGLYQAIYKRNIPLASGRYRNNNRVGMWHFYDTNGELVENYDYDRKAILYEKQDDNNSLSHIRYAFDNKINDSDYVTKPMKPGGRCYGYLPYINIFKLSDDFAGTDFSDFVAIIELLVSPGGRLADFKVHIKSQDFERITTFSTELIGESDKIFAPATINSKPVISRIFVKCRLTYSGELDID